MIQTTVGRAKVTFALDRLVDYSDDAMSTELRRVAALVDGPILTIGQFQARSRVSYNALWRRFGGWRQALARAGLAHRYSGQSVTEKMRLMVGRRMTDDALLDALRRAARRKKTRVLRVQDLDAACPIGYYAVARRFGSWAKALAKAGLAQHACGRRYADAECFENLRDLWTHLGHRPRYEDMMRPPSRVGVRAYLRRFGTWRRAVQAFVDWANARDNANSAPHPSRRHRAPPRDEEGGGRPKSSPRPEEGRRPVAKDEEPALAGVSKSAIKPQDRHHVALGLRFQVLTRDRFTCLACGDSPVKDKRCKLHVDHRVPFARGGRTVIENLRTLCAACNLGKGARLSARAAKKAKKTTEARRHGGRKKKE